MKPQDNSQQQIASVEHETETRERASATSEPSKDAGVAYGGATGGGEFGPMTADGRHHPIIGQRKSGATAALLRHPRDLWAVYVGKRLDPIFREQIMLAVAGADSSRQCSFAHREWALAEGLSKSDLAALEGLQTDAFDDQTWTAIAWAQAFARSDFADVPTALDAQFREQFSAQEQADIERAARTMYWLNETSNGVDAFLSRLKHAPVMGSTRRSELVALVLYAIAVPILVLMFSIRQPRSPISILRGMKPFFRQFEARGPNTISGPGVNFCGQSTCWHRLTRGSAVDAGPAITQFG